MHSPIGCFGGLGPRKASAALSLAVAALSLGTLFGCARNKEPEQAAPKPSADPALAVCTQLSAPGPLSSRFAEQLPLSQGGLLMLLAGTDPAAVNGVFSSFGLAATRVVGCGANDVVAWAPGVDANGATALEAALLKSAPATKITERALLSPAPGGPVPKPKRD